MHGSIRVGKREVFALCDAVFPATESPEDSFPPVTEEVWKRMHVEYPETFTDEGIWQLHGHCFLIRDDATAVLFDTGIGPPSAPAFAWAATEGRLPEELAAAGVTATDVDQVIISHCHDDHLGWTVGPDGTAPMFPNARYLLQRADWDIMHAETDPDDAEILAHTLEPLHRAGQLDLLDGDTDPASDLHLLLRRGHTPGHQVLAIDGAEPLLITADTFNHPALFVDPAWWGTSDYEPELASEVRAATIRTALDQELLIATSHLAEPFGHLRSNEDGSVAWSPRGGRT